MSDYDMDDFEDEFGELLDETGLTRASSENSTTIGSAMAQSAPQNLAQMVSMPAQLQ